MCFLRNKINEYCYECYTYKLAQTESFYMKPIDAKHLGIGFTRNMNTIGFGIIKVQKKHLKRNICVL